MATSAQRSNTRSRNTVKTLPRNVRIRLRRNSGPRQAVFAASFTKPENWSDKMRPFTSKRFPMLTSGSSHRLNLQRRWLDYPSSRECSANIITLLTARGDGCHAPPVTRWIPESGARNVTGLRMRRLVGPADASIFGIRSIPAACALPADINGQSPLA
jgi:hypothetical protein